ncbi:MAG: hypothetical protein HXX11_12825 [Desulfuromonadales bacterium]|nr:hypothetical protein [Desulfuromonadales bacterium]
MTVHRNPLILFCLLFLALSIAGCASLSANFSGARELPPILSQDELIRPHTKIGRIQITREVYGIIDPLMSPDIREWGYTAIRTEAAKMGADAVILPEVTGRSITYLVIPSTEYRATGVAIRFK